LNADALPDLRALARRHLRLRLRATNRALARAVERRAAAQARLARPELGALCVTDDEVLSLLDGLQGAGADEAPGAPDRPAAELAQELGQELAQEEELRALSFDRLPLDAVARAFGLSPFEQDALLLCAAGEVDSRYERVFAYIHDDLDRRHPSVDLLCNVPGHDTDDPLARRAEAGRFGRLRRTGLLAASGDARSELRQELRIAPALFEWLLTGDGDPAGFVDPAEVTLLPSDVAPAGVETTLLARVVGALCAGEISVVGLYGARGASHAACARAIAASVGRPLRRLVVDSPELLAQALAAATALGAILWLEVDALAEDGNARLCDLVASRLAAHRMPLLMSGVHPWRPAELLAARAYAELELALPDAQARQAMWTSLIPDAGRQRRADLAARYRMSAVEMQAVAGVARAAAHLRGNGKPLPIEDVVDDACATVSRKRSDHFSVLVRPRRGATDLVLAPDLHRQVMEIARFVRALPQVAEAWRFGRMQPGGGGFKVLFAGESGTGKTLAAEVVAGELALPMLRIDLARIVSKWVGETEKNLETAFREAEASHAILFFDEADALFGKRGEISHGVDRYANLEVSYLLQRLEEHSGLVILASNLRDQIDDAFVRRFHSILHFPRPGRDERARIWRLALPEQAPLGDDVDLAALARLDLTGAGIVGTAHTAALLAADEGAQAISMRHFVHAARRQFQREARLLSGSDLGPYASLLP
jgi:hypothetical protein